MTKLQSMQVKNFQGVFERNYILFEPAEIKSTVFAFHGFTEDSKAMQSYSQLQNVGQALSLRVVFMDGLLFHWDFWRKPPYNRDITYIQEMKNKFSPDQKIHIIGFSAGACLVNSLACVFAENIQSATSYAGYLSKGWKIDKTCNFPVLIIRNPDDMLVDAKETQNLIKAYKKAGYDPQTLSPTNGTPYNEVGELFHHYWNTNVNAELQKFLA